MPTSDTLSARILDLITPLKLLFMSFLALPRAFLSAPFLPITDFKEFQYHWFAELWKELGPQMALSPEQTPYISSLFGHAHGTVLELGPGNGDQMRHMLKPVSEGQIDRVIGAEPNVALHERLLANAKGIGLDPAKGKYVALEAGAEPASLIPALHKAGLMLNTSSTPGVLDSEGIFDTVICIKSMCSAPQDQMEQICMTIHTLLKPGGEFLFFEHVKNDTSLTTGLWAGLLNIVWPIAMGNCHLNGRVDKVVKGMAPGLWESVDVGNTREFRGWNVFRYVVGVCRKAS